jgi:hypothetical protein
MLRFSVNLNLNKMKSNNCISDHEEKINWADSLLIKAVRV